MGTEYIYDICLKGLAPIAAVKEIASLEKSLKFVEKTTAYYFSEDGPELKKVLLKLQKILPQAMATGTKDLETGDIPVKLYRKVIPLLGKGKGMLSFPIGFTGIKNSKSDIWGDIWVRTKNGKADLTIHKSTSYKGQRYTSKELAEIKEKTGLVLKAWPNS
jgi:hypothetical protein